MKPDMLIKCVELQLGRKTVKLEDRFYEDLAAESIDMVHLVVAVEEITGIFIPEEIIPELKTVRDLLNAINKREK
jgi:acyl carrier protein